MSKIGKKILKYDTSVKIENKSNILSISGAKGSVNVNIIDGFEVLKDDTNLTIQVLKKSESAESAIWGTFLRQIENTIIGVSKGFSRTIELVGIGYKVSIEKDELILKVGYSHQTGIKIPQEIKVTLEGATKFTLTTFNKELLGNFVTKVCNIRKYNIYTGSGIIDLHKKSLGLYIIKERKKK